MGILIGIPPQIPPNIWDHPPSRLPSHGSAPFLLPIFLVPNLLGFQLNWNTSRFRFQLLGGVVAITSKKWTWQKFWIQILGVHMLALPSISGLINLDPKWLEIK